MAQATWEKTLAPTDARTARRSGERRKFLIGGALILAAVVYLILSNTAAGARFFVTVEEVLDTPALVGQQVRVSGAVIGDTIRYDSETLLIEFSVAHVGDLSDNPGEVLHLAANDPTATRMQVRVENTVKPDLLRHEAQAIMTGYLDENGVFQVSELNLKCPSRFIEGGPGEMIAEPQV